MQVHDIYVDDLEQLPLTQFLALRWLCPNAASGFSLVADPAQARAIDVFQTKACLASLPAVPGV